jgi:hypothetical protein
MFWKFFRLQTLINALFDDSWCDLGLPEGPGYQEPQLADWA